MKHKPTLEESIRQLEELRHDRESFLNGFDDGIYLDDIAAIDIALEHLKQERRTHLR